MGKQSPLCHITPTLYGISPFYNMGVLSPFRFLLFSLFHMQWSFLYTHTHTCAHELAVVDDNWQICWAKGCAHSLSTSLQRALTRWRSVFSWCSVVVKNMDFVIKHTACEHSFQYFLAVSLGQVT